jgi:RNA recognition motif-containing protein
MGKRIYVGNLPWSVVKVKLEELFKPFGEIEEALVIADKYTGKSRGFGFVTYKNDADADKAMKEMDNKDVEGRNIVVKEARPLGEAKEKPKEELVAESEKKGKPEKKPKETGKKPKTSKKEKKEE